MALPELRVTHSRCLHCGEEFEGRPYQCDVCLRNGDDARMLERLHRTSVPLGQEDDDDFVVRPLGGGEPFYEYPVDEEAWA